MQDTEKTVMLAFRLPADKRDAFKSYCLERHTTVQAMLRSAVDRHLAEADNAVPVNPARACTRGGRACLVRCGPGVPGTDQEGTDSADQEGTASAVGPAEALPPVRQVR